jgi:catechol 2,3-dioxygenase-like lactoylglutathione lyase family enzyme
VTDATAGAGAIPQSDLALDHAGTSVADLARSLRFFGDAFGFGIEETFSIPATDVRGVVLRHLSGARIELFHDPGSVATPPGDPVGSAGRRGWFQVAFRVRDLAAAYSRAIDAGGAAVRPPFLAPDGRSSVAFLCDPDGNLIELIQRAAGR